MKGMKILPWFVLFGLGSAFADDVAPQRTHVSAESVLASVPAAPTPSTPQLLHVSTPNRAVILHGDLFGDGRHLALVGSDNTTLAVHQGGNWKILQTEEVCPAWLSPGKTAFDEGYSRCKPAANPFTLADLDGDKVPELLVDIDFGVYNTGCRIARVEGKGVRFLNIVSAFKRPRIKEGLMLVVTEISGRKAWWGVATYYRWKDGTPIPVARWVDDHSNPLKWRRLAENIRPDGSSMSFEIRENPENDVEWLVSRCTWKTGVETENEQAFAKLTFSEDGMPVEHTDRIDPVMFEVLTGISAAAFQPDHDAKEFDLKNVRVQVDGSEEARKVLKRIDSQTHR